VVSEQRILVVDDDPTVAEVVVRYLERDGYVVESVGDGEAAVESARASRPRLVVLDLMLPGLDGLEVCRRLRELARVPIVMLTARGEEEDRVVGLELGADDYLTKPFSPRELMARVRAVLRRADEPVVVQVEPRSEFGRLVIDRAAREVTVDGALVVLTAREFDLLAFMARHPHRVFRREELLEHVWGFTVGDTATVTVHIRRVREKIEREPSSPEHLVTAWGVGYRFEPGTTGACAATPGTKEGT
jgi:DNA-binding response OmpR family regulator